MPLICATVRTAITGTTMPIQCRPSCFLRVRADMGGPIEARPRRNRTRHRAIELAAEFFFHQPEEFLDTDLVEHILKPRLGAICTVAGLNEYAHHRIRNHCRIAGLYQNTRIARETLVAGQTTEAEFEPDAVQQPKPIVDLHCLEADVVCVLEYWYRAGAVEGDVEFAGKAVKGAIIENMEVPLCVYKAACRSIPADRCRRSACR